MVIFLGTINISHSLKAARSRRYTPFLFCLYIYLIIRFQKHLCVNSTAVKNTDGRSYKAMAVAWCDNIVFKDYV